MTLPNLLVSAGAAVELCGLHPTLALMPTVLLMTFARHRVRCRA